MFTEAIYFLILSADLSSGVIQQASLREVGHYMKARGHPQNTGHIFLFSLFLSFLSFFVIEARSLLPTLELTKQPVLCDLQESVCLCLPRVVIISMCHHVQPFRIVVGFELRSLCMQNKHFPH